MVKIKPYKNQDYQLLHEQHNSTRLFTDPEFLACIKSISHSGKLVVRGDAENSILNLLEWRRPYVNVFFYYSKFVSLISPEHSSRNFLQNLVLSLMGINVEIFLKAQSITVGSLLQQVSNMSNRSAAMIELSRCNPCLYSKGLLTLDQDLLAFVIPNNQTFDPSEYTGKRKTISCSK